MDHQSVTFGVWIGIAVLALGWSNFKIWQRRRALNRVVQKVRVEQQNRVEHQDRPVSAQLVPELTSPVMTR